MNKNGQQKSVTQTLIFLLNTNYFYRDFHEIILGNSCFKKKCIDINEEINDKLMVINVHGKHEARNCIVMRS